jgi:hypothetical protein
MSIASMNRTFTDVEYFLGMRAGQKGIPRLSTKVSEKLWNLSRKHFRVVLPDKHYIKLHKY